MSVITNHAVPIRVVGEPGTTPPAQVATFFWVDANGEIARTLQTVPIQNGVALYSGDPLPQGARWAITVHDPAGLPIYRSGRLSRLPGAFSPLVFGSRISAFRASRRGAFGINSPDGMPELVNQRLAQLPSVLRVESVRLAADNAGHEVVIVTGHLRVFFFFRRSFSYALPLTLRPATQPGRPEEVVIVERAAAGSGSGANLGGFVAVLDQAIIEGVRNALNAAFKWVASLEFTLFGIDFPPSLVSVTSIEVTPIASDPQIIATVHAGAVIGDIRTVVFENERIG